MDFLDLTPEQQEKARACKTTAELVELAKSSGIELSDEQLENIAGGSWNCDGYCSDNCFEEWLESTCTKKDW